MKPFFSCLIIFCFLAPALRAQDHIGLRHRVFQASLIYPLSTNGVKAGSISNSLSLNLIAGYNGGLQGIEIGGVLNTIRYNANGIQMSGFGNIVGRNVNGLQMAGFLNLAGYNANGMQMAGFANLAARKVNGFQFSGFVNVAGKKVRGGQFAGFANLSGSDLRGVQTAGFANVVAGDVKGLQLSGFLNVAQRLSGVQIGVVNFVDELESGMPIGLISIVRKGGIRAVSIARTDLMSYEISARLGAPAFYNILTFGWHPMDNAPTAWAIGYGVGAMTKPERNLGIQVEAVSYQLFEDGSWNVEELNMINRLSGNLQLRLLGGLSFYGGVAGNVAVSQRVNREGIMGSSLLPENLYEDGYADGGRTRISIFPGFQFGAMIEL